MTLRLFSIIILKICCVCVCVCACVCVCVCPTFTRRWLRRSSFSDSYAVSAPRVEVASPLCWRSSSSLTGPLFFLCPATHLIPFITFFSSCCRLVPWLPTGVRLSYLSPRDLPDTFRWFLGLACSFWDNVVYVVFNFSL